MDPVVVYDDEMNPKDKDSKPVRPPSVPNLRWLDIKSAERLRDVPKKPNSCAPPPLQSLLLSP